MEPKQANKTTQGRPGAENYKPETVFTTIKNSLMNSKTIYIIAVIFVVLAIAAFFVGKKIGK